MRKKYQETYRETNKTRMIVWILGVVILILSMVILVMFVFMPQYQNFVADKKIEGYNIGVNDGINYCLEDGIFGQLNEKGFVELTYANTTLILVPYNPQQPQQ